MLPRAKVRLLNPAAGSTANNAPLPSLPVKRMTFVPSGESRLRGDIDADVPDPARHFAADGLRDARGHTGGPGLIHLDAPVHGEALLRDRESPDIAARPCTDKVQ